LLVASDARPLAGRSEPESLCINTIFFLTIFSQNTQMAAEPTIDKPKTDTLDDGDSFGSLKLTSKDGKSFDVDRKCAFISTLVKTGLDTGTEEKKTH
jgi:hypothetical protein